VVKGLGGRVVDRQRVWRGLCELEMHVLEVQRCGVWLIGCSGIRRENQGRGFVCEGCYFGGVELHGYVIKVAGRGII